ncbi:MAG: hypothetical protein LBI64_07950 [Coriobacteriales bacterium]|jgi:shikimate dehydrogenase|nr:hypothetical protein [Coriobacteriales bacterium]
MKCAGLAGYPIEHSLSPALHTAVYRELGLDWKYDLYPCADEHAFAKLVEQLRGNQDIEKPEWVGLNVTTPYKPQAHAACDTLTPRARMSAAVNVLTSVGVKAGRGLVGGGDAGRGLVGGDAGRDLADEDAERGLAGDNTDGHGLLAALERETGITPAGRRFVICGSGAVTRSILAAFEVAARDGKVPAAVVVLSRRASGDGYDRVLLHDASLHDSALPHDGAPFYGVVRSYDEVADVLANSDVLIDATTLGMKAGDPSPVPEESMRRGLVVIDTVYGHGETALLRAARMVGAPAFDGLGMLVEQAALTIENWLAAQGISAEVPRELMYTVAQRETLTS